MDLEDAVNELNERISNAVEFISTEYEPDWERAEKFYNGKTDLATVENRSNVVKTEVRDAIRNTLPSIMRVLLQTTKIVEYIPNNPANYEWVDQQSEYITQLFWQCDGYRQLHNAILDAAKRRYGILCAYFEKEPKNRYVKYTKVPYTLFEQLMDMPNVEIIDYEPVDDTQGVTLYDVSLYETFEHGKIIIESIPTEEFFIDERSTSIGDAIERGVHGQRRVVTVSEAEEMGLEYDDWESLDSEEPEESLHGGSSQQNRRYVVSQDLQSKDPALHEFLLTQVYVSYDLKGTGKTQLYKFYLGGTNYTYIYHEEVEDSPYEIAQLNLRAHAFAGDSIADLTINEQNTSTSLLRAMLDNAHMSNNPRFAANPRRTEFSDLVNPALGAPIRHTGDQPIQTVAIPFTGQGLLPVMQYLDLDTQTKVGVTKAAQGLDPDALQSTDKDAVRNTIATSQGQVELMVRNLVETCLIPLFRKVLVLATRHFSPNQVMMTKGKVIPINLNVFNPNLAARPNVGIGTATTERKRAALGFVLQQQQAFIQQFGPNNPFTSYAKMYNTLEDMLEADGIYNIGRYFNIVTPEVEKRIAEGMQQQRQAAMESQPPDPVSGMMEIERAKQQTKLYEVNKRSEIDKARMAQESVVDEAKLNLEKDKLIQERALKLLELEQKDEEARIKKEQDRDNVSTTSRTVSSSQTSGEQ